VYEAGVRRTRTLGEWGSQEADAAYKQFLAEFSTGVLDRPCGHTLSVNELFFAFIKHAEQHYRRPDGTPTHEVVEYKILSRLVREVYGHTAAKDFGPLAVKAVRQRMVDRQLARTLINNRVRRLKHVFKWAAGEELIPFEVYHRLTAVMGLQKGRTTAPESEPVGPVADAVVETTLPQLNRHVRGLVEFQRLTGCRPGEACQLRRCDIDTSAPVWLYRPVQHKTGWRGKQRVIAIGPMAQELLKVFFTTDITDYLFSPRRAVEELNAQRSENRKTPKYPSHMARNTAKRVTAPKRPPAEAYTALSYCRCIARACDRAFPPPAPLAKLDNETLAEWDARLSEQQKKARAIWQISHRWHPNQLRHSFATRVRNVHGLEAAQVLLGHSRADVTQVYAQRNETLASEIAAKIG
jgi:integrase